jgi:low affinity Fe/Cu permease
MKRKQSSQGLFYKLARKTSEAVGSPFASIGAVTVVFVWATTGPSSGKFPLKLREHIAIFVP